MHCVWLILPSFVEILLGCLLRTKLDYPRVFWDKAEKLVFYILFPPLLFTSVASSHAAVGQAGPFLLTAIAVMLLATLSSWFVCRLCATDRITVASVFQCGFRFNTYIGFAVCLPLLGDQGFSLLALIIAAWVPICNTIAVTALASATAQNSSGGRVWPRVVRSILTNPLIIATSLGLLANICQVEIPVVLKTLLKDLGSASLALGLLCIGAGLRLTDLKEHRKMITLCTLQRLVLAPALACVLCWLVGLSPIESAVVILFAALPTAQSCYVMTASMGGNATAVASVTTAQTLAAVVSLSAWSTLIVAIAH